MPLLLGICLLGATSGGALAAGAQKQPLLSEEDFLGEMPVVLSATRMAQPLSETPAATTIIDRQMIEASGARSIVDVFRLVPGLLVGYQSGNRPVVTTHGFGDVYARRMQVLIDGRSVYVPAYGGVPWADLPLVLEDVERIEVVRGPNAASYGANSFLGIISITTHKPSDAQGSQVKLSAGTQSIRGAVVRTGDHVGKLDYHLSVGQQQDSGFRARNDGQKHQFLITSLSYPLGGSEAADLQFGYSGGMDEKGLFRQRHRWDARTTDHQPLRAVTLAARSRSGQQSLAAALSQLPRSGRSVYHCTHFDPRAAVQPAGSHQLRCEQRTL